MDALVEYLIPVSGLKIGSHSFDFQVDSAFFTHFPDSLIKEGSFKVQLDFDKRIDLYEMNFSFEGTTKSACDRCLAAVDFPVSGNNRLIVKFAETYKEDVDVIYIPIKTETLNVAKYIYEYLSLAVPYVKIYDCEADKNKPCDTEMLAFLDQQAAAETENTPNSAWDQLKNIKFN